MAFAYRLTRFVKRVLLPLVAVIYILASAFDLHTRNLVNNNFTQLSPYTGGPIEDVKRITCYSWYGSCNQIIERTFDEDGQPQEVVWMKVPKALDLDGQSSQKRWSWYHDFLYVRPSLKGPFNTPGKAIVDLMIGSSSSTEPPAYVVKDAQTSVGRPKSRLDITYNYNNWDLKQDGIWVKYDKDTADDAIRDIQYLFGNDVIEPRDDWKLVQGSMRLSHPSPIRIIIKNKKSSDSINPRAMLRLDGQGHFKVLQLSDMHFSSDFGSCKDQAGPVEDKATCKADSKTTNFIHQVMDLEKPQLVVITGDLLDGINTFDYQTALLKALSPMISRSVPFAIAFGEHDSNKYASRPEIVNFITTLPYSTMIRSSEEDTYQNMTNYVLPIYNAEGTQIINAIYIMDLLSSSNTFSQDHAFSTAGFLQASYNSLQNKPIFSLAFQHLPIREYRPKEQFAIVGEYNEKHKLKSKTDANTRQALSDINVQALSVGSEHTNECCILSEGEKLNSLWMCFGGSVGEGAYSDGKHDRRLRLFRMDNKGREIASWKRRQGKPQDVFDYQYILKL